MQKVSLKSARGMLSMMLCAGLAGCAANPYSPATLPKPGSINTGKASIPLAEALDYLHALRDDYRSKRSAEFDRQQALTSSLFGMGALAIGLGAYGAHPDATKAVALGGATAYQIGKWHTDPGRTSLYGEGIGALTCAEAVMTPVLVAVDQRAAVAQALRAVRARQAAAMHAHAALLAVITSTTLTAETQAAYGLTIVASDREMRRAVRAITRAQAWTSAVESSGNVLNDQVEQVRNAVDQALSGRVPELDKLMDAVNGLSSYATFFSAPAADGGTPVATTLRTPQTAPNSQGQPRAVQLPGASQVGALVEATGELALAVNELIDSQPKIAAAATQARLAGCNIGKSAVPAALQIEPSEIEATAGEPRDIMVEIKGPEGVYATAFQGDAHPGIAVTPPAARVFTVKIGAAALPGSYIVRVQGENQAWASLKLQVLAKPATAVDKPSPAKKAAPKKPAATVPPAVPPAVTPAVPPTADAGDACIPVADPASCKVAGVLCQFECKVGATEVYFLRQRLGLPVTPSVFDDKVRAALKQKQIQLHLMPQDGNYNAATARALQPAGVPRP